MIAPWRTPHAWVDDVRVLGATPLSRPRLGRVGLFVGIGTDAVFADLRAEPR